MLNIVYSMLNFKDSEIKTIQATRDKITPAVE